MTMVQTFSAGNTILTQGFQQPNELPLGLLDLTRDEYGAFVVYPKPSVDKNRFGFELPEAGRVLDSMYDELGQKISDIYSANYQNGKIVQQTDVSKLAAASYYMRLTFTSDKDGKTHITTKKLQVIR
jgi:hypothetical protein